MKLLAIVTLWLTLFSLSTYAKDKNFDKYINKPYSSARASLISEGWIIVANKNIQDSSIFAQGVSDQGYEEVLDCISMERDQCQFVLRKNKQLIVITTKEKAMNVNSIKYQK